MQFYSATQDLCFQVYGRKARQLYPWDLEDPDNTSTEKDLESGGRESTSDTFEWDSVSDKTGPSTMSRRSLKKSKIFEDEVPIEDEYVRNVQRARYIRTWVVATVIACVVVAVFLGVPNLPY